MASLIPDSVRCTRRTRKRDALWVKCRGDGSLWVFLTSTFQHFSAPSTSSLKRSTNRFSFKKSRRLSDSSSFSPPLDLASVFLFLHASCRALSLTPSVLGGCADPQKSQSLSNKRKKKKKKPTVLPGLFHWPVLGREEGKHG